jgi:hydroxymethylglutaryl-CoA lyase
MSERQSVLGRMPDRVTVFEVGPRDGLQNESVPIPTEMKVALVHDLLDAGLKWIETTSFVNPKAVPQLADASEVMAAVERREGVRYPVLVPNERGMQRALESGVDSIAVFTAASEEFSQANVRGTINQTFERFHAVIELAKANDVWTRGYVSMAFHCPYEGQIAPEKAVHVAQRLFDLGIDEVAIADTVGRATPLDVGSFLDLAVTSLPVERLAFHLHDTNGLALTNVLLALEAGITVIDGAAGGLGGCPFAPGAPGNLATEKLVTLLDGLGIETGVSATAIEQAGLKIRGFLSHQGQ